LKLHKIAIRSAAFMALTGSLVCSGLAQTNSLRSSQADPVSKYLADFDNLQVITKFNEKDATYETRPAKRPMTIRHLLTHTSGIAYGSFNPIVYRLKEATKKHEWELPLLNDPGDKWNYGPSTAVLGMIVEKISGESLEAYFQQHIFVPLGKIPPRTRVRTHYGAISRLQTEP
jgi:hypothetical protein